MHLTCSRCNGAATQARCFHFVSRFLAHMKFIVIVSQWLLHGPWLSSSEFQDFFETEGIARESIEDLFWNLCVWEEGADDVILQPLGWVIQG